MYNVQRGGARHERPQPSEPGAKFIGEKGGGGKIWFKWTLSHGDKEPRKRVYARGERTAGLQTWGAYGPSCGSLGDRTMPLVGKKAGKGVATKTGGKKTTGTFKMVP